MSAFVYLAWNADGDLLYVGHTKNVATRMRGHKSGSGWYADMARLDVEEYPSSDEAKWAERLYIGDLEPLHNVLGNPRFHPEPYEVDMEDA